MHSTTVTRVQRRAVPSPVPYRPLLHPRQPTTLVQTSFPPYASPCSNTIRYSSACTCLGATHTTITDLTPTIIVVRTATTTTTATKTLCGSPLPKFLLRGSGGGAAGHTAGGDGVVDGAYATLVPVPDIGSAIIRFTPTKGNATTFSLNHQCVLDAHDPTTGNDDGSNRILANFSPDGTVEIIYFNSRADIKKSDFVPIECQLVDKEGGKGKKLACSFLECDSGGQNCVVGNILQLCPILLRIGGSEVAFGSELGAMCDAFDLDVVEV